MYRLVRKQAGIGTDEAALMLNLAPRTLSKYEAGDTSPPSEVVLAMAKAYGASLLTLHHCRHQCAIGSAYSFEILDGVNMDPATVLLKVLEEMSEAQDAIHGMLRAVVNKNRREDFAPREWATLINGLHELIDYEHTVEILKVALSGWCDISEVIAQHNLKCQQRGYTEKKKTASKAARKTLSYSLAQ